MKRSVWLLSCGLGALKRPRQRPKLSTGIRTLVSAADVQFGQPLHETHPHIIGPGEPQALPKDSIAVVAASDIKYRSGAVFYEFHQDPNFLYLTGFNEPEALAVIG
ncbi:hypothetical protein LTR28_004608, partial [Elasticomyces elasticus]